MSMITTECARESLPLWCQEPDSHLGNFIRNKLGYEWQSIYKTGYLWPPVGGFFTHESATASSERMTVILADHFDHCWAQEGTRKLLSKQEHRWVCAFTVKDLQKRKAWLGEIMETAITPRSAKPMELR